MWACGAYIYTWVYMYHGGFPVQLLPVFVYDKYLSSVRVFDPEYAASLLLQNTFALNMVVYETMIIASAILYGSIQSLMRYVWNTAGFITIHERDLTIGVYEAAWFASRI